MTCATCHSEATGTLQISLGCIGSSKERRASRKLLAFLKIGLHAYGQIQGPQKRGTQYWPLLHKPHELCWGRLRNGSHSAVSTKNWMRHADNRLREARSGAVRTTRRTDFRSTRKLHKAILGPDSTAGLRSIAGKERISR